MLWCLPGWIFRTLPPRPSLGFCSDFQLLIHLLVLQSLSFIGNTTMAASRASFAS